MSDDAVTLARARLHTALVPLLSEGHVHRLVPAQLVTPCMWIERARLYPRVQGRATRITIVELPVMVAVDGDDEQQQEALDRLVAQVWDACELVPGCQAVGANPRLLSELSNRWVAATTSTVAMQIDTETSISARSLCPPPAPVRITADV